MAQSGVLLYPKPAGVTSHDVVAVVRRRLSEESGQRVKVGHAGTLDPFATGLLLVLVGAATRAQRFLMALPKTYRTVARLGWTSDTGDPEGELIHTGRVPEELELPTGEMLQTPPAYSAVKVGGERLYAKARRGEFVHVDARPVSVYRFDLMRRDGDRAELEIECSSGTYVRQLIADLGDAYCEELQRTAIGPFRLDRGFRGAADLPRGGAGVPAGTAPGGRRGAVGIEWRGRGTVHSPQTTDHRALIMCASCTTIALSPSPNRATDQLKPIVVFRVKVTSLHDVEPRPRRVAVGTFDGVHLGHREVIRGQ